MTKFVEGSNPEYNETLEFDIEAEKKNFSKAEITNPYNKLYFILFDAL